MLTKYITLGLILLLIPTGLALDISECKSDSTNWLCERGEMCVCTITDTCTNGNVLLYENDVSQLLCAPKITDNKAYIDWSYCNTTLDSIRLRADCDQGQSAERMIILSGVPTTVATTIATTTPTTTQTTETTEYTGMCGDDGYCENINNECLMNYEDCSVYDDECNVDERCCCPSAGPTTTTPSDGGGFNYLYIIPVIIVIIVVVIYFFFIRGRERETMLTFKRLYEKWSR